MLPLKEYSGPNPVIVIVSRLFFIVPKYIHISQIKQQSFIYVTVAQEFIRQARENVIVDAR